MAAKVKRVVKTKENLNVLVIEDNATSGATLVGLLEEQGITNIVLMAWWQSPKPSKKSQTSFS